MQIKWIKYHFKLQHVQFFLQIYVPNHILMWRAAVKGSCDPESLDSLAAEQRYSLLKVSPEAHPSNQSDKADYFYLTGKSFFLFIIICKNFEILPTFLFCFQSEYTALLLCEFV